MFSCGYTQGWVSEIFEGLIASFPFWAGGAAGDNVSPNADVGYSEVSGDSVTAIFQSTADSDGSYMFRIYHGGLADHVLLVEQLAHRRGYRVYQSYNSAYSLHAWLSNATTPEGLEHLWSSDSTTGHIIPNDKLAAVMSASLAALNPAWTLESPPTLEELRASPALPGPMADAVYAFLTTWTPIVSDKAVIFDYLIDSKKRFGGGRVIPPAEFMQEYVSRMATLSAFYVEAGPPGSSSMIVTQDIFDMWAELYGSPNPQVSPNLPFNFIAALNSMLSGQPIDPEVRYFLQVQVTAIDGEASMCADAAAVLKHSLPLADQGSTSMMRRS
mmetsp:Transcript_6039/g.16393  ORF Transcript_6039/g.16393 Transcript_6039/m.16393 type:complete len:328 (-) Transcript_6039:327-1310(-)|eukprot:CAMPEP_0185171718 /NCGR_PEP_ID=MMETSP1139-20130426/20526_1 /TAXON_ID=298111 /ORGANISM="Pavlova sp., Strain CCMP459" /LENGTH=327 /DNA_ID=CAMNT_0027737337 /DNA_START=130 /DNA_END=1113 /DNA_ORIENTATION=+